MQLYKLESLNKYYAVKGNEVFAYLEITRQWVGLESATASAVRNTLKLVGNNFKPRGL